MQNPQFIKTVTLLFYELVALLFISCSITRLQQKGNVSQDVFTFETFFTTQKSIPILPFDFDGITKNFLFDTGADVSLIQREYPIGRTQKQLCIEWRFGWIKGTNFRFWRNHWTDCN